MVNKILEKRRTKVNSLKNEIASLKDELLESYRKIDKKDQLVIELYCIRDEKQRKINEVLDENKELREKDQSKLINKDLRNKIKKALEIIKEEKADKGYGKYDSCLLLIEQVLEGSDKE